MRELEPLDSLNVRRIVRRFLKRTPQIAIVLLIVLVPAAIATYLATPLFRSTALLQVSPDPVQLLPYRDVADSVVSGGNYDNYMGTQERILNSAMLRSRVERRLSTDLKADPAGAEVSQLGDRFAIKKVEKSELFELSYLSPDPAVSATVVNLFAEEYLKHNFELRQTTRVKAEGDLKKELEALEKRLQLSEKELMTYAETNDIMSLEQGQVDPLQERLSALNQEVATSEAAVAVSKSSYDSLSKATFSEFPQRLSTEQISSLSGKVMLLEQELTTLRGTFGENWPAVVDKRGEVAIVKQQLAQEKSAVLARNLEQARLDLEGAEARRHLAQQALDEQKGLINQFHKASIEKNILKREVDTNRNLYDGLLQRLRQTGVLAGFQIGNIQIVEQGQPNHIADSPSIVWNLGLATLLGLALGTCLVILMDYWDTSITTLEEVEDLSPLPSLGSVPFIKNLHGSSKDRKVRELGSGTGLIPALSQSEIAMPFELRESVGSICASILLSRSDARPRVILVTSATSAEGKTTLVSHLGRAFAEAGSKTLLVEADLRKPDLSKQFSIDSANGLSLYLAGLVPSAPSIQATEFPNLFVAPGGPVPPNPAALLLSEKMSDFLKVASAEYQFVILDAPPLLSIADARILGSKADGVVLVVRAGQTAKDQVRRSCTLLEQSGANVLGMVLNGWKPGRADLSHYRYYQPEA